MTLLFLTYTFIATPQKEVFSPIKFVTSINETSLVKKKKKTNNSVTPHLDGSACVKHILVLAFD